MAAGDRDLEGRLDRPASILAVRGHRPYPLPRGRWAGRMRWLDLLFAHWPIATEALRPLVPAALQLDLFDGRAWVGIVPFRMENVRLRFMPALPWLSAFPELNVRTYVSFGGRPGVFFFSLDAANPVAVAVARRLLHLPYFKARMSCRPVETTIDYESERTHPGAPTGRLRARYGPTGPVQPAAAGSLEYFLTERYCLYAVSPGGAVIRTEIHHRPWPLQAAWAEIETDTLAAGHRLALEPVEPLLHFSRRQEVLAWPPARVDRP